MFSRVFLGFDSVFIVFLLSTEAFSTSFRATVHSARSERRWRDDDVDLSTAAAREQFVGSAEQEP